MKTLVVGGLGFIGHRVTRQLIDAGREVEVLDLCAPYEGSGEANEAYEARMRQRVDVIEDTPVHRIDLRDENATRATIAEVRPDLVIHLASIPVAGLALKAPGYTASQMVTGTANLLEACRIIGVSRFVYVSSSMVYGDFVSDPAPETHPTQCADVYGNLKLASERLTLAYRALHGMDCLAVRPMAVYGPTGNEQFVITKFVRAALEGRPIQINGEDTRLDLTFVDDTAAGLILAALSPDASGEVFNIAAGRPRLLVDAARILSEIVGDLDLTIQPREGHYPKRGGLDISKARQVLGFEPRFDLEEGLRVMVDAYAALT